MDLALRCFFSGNKLGHRKVPLYSSVVSIFFPESESDGNLF